MAVVQPLWFTPQEIKDRIGDPNKVDTQTVIDAEVYNQLYYLNANGPIVIVTNMKQETGVTSGTTFTSAALINATLFNVFYGGNRLNSTTNPDYSFDDTTGEITFLIDITDGLELAIDYATNP